MSTILFVGEVNPLSTKPEHALYPWPPNCTGERLQRLVLGVSRREYLDGFDRVDLCTGRWSAPAARAEAARLLAGTWQIYVLLGRKVTTAFGRTEPAFTLIPEIRAGAQAVVLPHPSGLCRAWHELGAYERARTVLRQAGALRRP